MYLEEEEDFDDSLDPLDIVENECMDALFDLMDLAKPSVFIDE